MLDPKVPGAIHRRGARAELEGPGEGRGVDRYGSGDTGSLLLAGPVAAGGVGVGVRGAVGLGDRSSGVPDAEAVAAESLFDPR